MVGQIKRCVSLVFAASFSFLTIDGGGNALLAQAPNQSVSLTVDELLPRINAMQQELDSLREQKAVTAAAPIRIVGLTRAGVPLECDGVDGCDSPAVCTDGGYYGGYDNCGCTPCRCGRCPAPCVDCPGVSTLSPYFNVNVFGALKMDAIFSLSTPSITSRALNHRGDGSSSLSTGRHTCIVTSVMESTPQAMQTYLIALRY